MPCYEYLCKTCKTNQERYLPISDYRIPQYCKKCKKQLTRVISNPIVLIPAWWSNSDNDFDIAKPQNEEQQKKYRDFMENSIPISRSTR